MASSSDEGEIVEAGNSNGNRNGNGNGNVGDLKASSLPYTEGSGVDRQDRTRSRRSTRSPDHDAASRYSNTSSSRRSPSPRGYKRSRDDRDREWDIPTRERDRGGRDRDHGRHGRYDASHRDAYRRSRVSYEDLDQPASSRASDYSYDERGYDRRRDRDYDRDRARGRDRSRDRDRYRDDDRDYYADKRPRRDGRSPQRSGRADRRKGQAFISGGRLDTSNDSFSTERGGKRQDASTNGSTAKQANLEQPKVSRDDAKPGRGSDAVDKVTEQSQPAPEPQPEEDFVEPEPIDEEAEIERRRKRREELLAKSSSATPLLLHAVGAGDKARAASPFASQTDSPQKSQQESDTPATPRTPRSGMPSLVSVISRANRSDLASPRSPGLNEPHSPSGLDFLANRDAGKSSQPGAEEDGPSAADYDPTIDMKEDERRDELRHGQVVLHGESHVVESTEPKVEGNGQAPKSNQVRDDDDDEFDMFAEDFDEDKYEQNEIKTAAPLETADKQAAPGKRGGILEGDDKDGYYKFRAGEVLDGRYRVQATLGRGMFSGVVRAVDVHTSQPVAIKIMRNNDALKKGGNIEIAILQKLNDADPENRKHIVKFERSFDYSGHLCMAFESLSLNLREVIRKFGNNVGINMAATRTYAYQIFVALAHMRKCSIIHADLKPDNILVNESHKTVKICDLGTAIDRSDAATAHTAIAPYLVSRFYRAPEIILGIPYDYGVDMWSIGCTLYELYTGKILFTGDSNNQMLKAIMEIRGRLTPKLYKRGEMSDQHFDAMGQFRSVERDKILGKTTVRTLPMVKPTRDLRTRLMTSSSAGGLSEGEARELHHFVDLLEHCLALNPDKRMKPADALRHPFFTSKIGGGRR